MSSASHLGSIAARSVCVAARQAALVGVHESLDLGQRPLGDLAARSFSCSQRVAQIAAIAHELGAAAADRPETLVDRFGYQALERGATRAADLGGDLGADRDA
jgi:hypothetical protein